VAPLGEAGYRFGCQWRSGEVPRASPRAQPERPSSAEAANRPAETSEPPIITNMAGVEIVREITEVTMPAGEYWVGDPCYAVPREQWQTWLDASWAVEGSGGILIADIDRSPVLGIATAFGDGVYEAEDGTSFPVDAGMIGLVSVDVARPDVRDDLMVRRDFAEAVVCRRDGAQITIGDFVIRTD
jgi:hypothetical protein